MQAMRSPRCAHMMPVQMITVRPTAFTPAITGEKTAAKVTLISQPCNQSNRNSSRQSNTSTERPDLTSAAMVIAGGRGLGDKENFARLVLSQTVCMRPSAHPALQLMLDLAPNDWQVGQTGKVVAPKLYIALGISGAIQHLAGMKESKVIVAINKDPDAPIFQIADYGLVADINSILNEWEQYLNI